MNNCWRLWCFLLAKPLVPAYGQELHDSALFVHHGSREMTLAQQVGRATAIVEGRLATSRTFWNAAHTRIYTAYTVQVYKVFKGVITGPTIELLYFGGQVGSQAQEFAHNPNPTLNERQPVGLLFLQPAREASVGSRFPRGQQFEGIEAPDGAIVYDADRDDPTGVSFWRRWHHVPQTLYAPLQQLVGQPYREVAPFDLTRYHPWEERDHRTPGAAPAKNRPQRPQNAVTTGAKKKTHKAKTKRKL